MRVHRDPVAFALFIFALAITLVLARRADAADFKVWYALNAPGTNSGTEPTGPLRQGVDGNFYGTALEGGTHGTGTVFKLTPSLKFTLLHSFNSENAAFVNSGGAFPGGALAGDGQDYYYGTTEGGSTNGNGAVFEITAAGGFKLLHTFSALASDGTNADGALPTRALVSAIDGNLYGTAAKGGAHGKGTIFRLTTGGAFTLLHSFTEGPASANAFASASLIEGYEGTFFGTTPEGGTNGTGEVFKMTADGTVTVLHNFSAVDAHFDNGDGAVPLDGVILASDGNLYGTTSGGGAHNFGVIFKLAADGTGFTNLHDFAGGNDGGHPNAGVLQASDGRFYGTTTEGNGANKTGTVYRLNADNTLTALHNFDAQNSSGLNSDGSSPVSRLSEPIPGTLVGTTQKDGPYGGGTIFALYLTPFITSPSTATANVGSLAFYQINSNVNPVIFSADGLSDGLNLDRQSGLITGAPTQTGTVNLTVRATNEVGTGARAVTITVNGPLPVITSGDEATAQVGQAFSYQITATNNATSFGVNGLRPGLSVNASTGLISGTPTGAGTFTLGLSASNSQGTGSQDLSLTILPSTPVLTSANTASATAGQPFSYQIRATSSPTSYDASGLFDGLSVNPQTGLIHGTPTTVGTHTLDVNATNAGGTGHETLTLTVTAD